MSAMDGLAPILALHRVVDHAGTEDVGRSRLSWLLSGANPALRTAAFVLVGLRDRALERWTGRRVQLRALVKLSFGLELRVQLRWRIGKGRVVGLLAVDPTRHPMHHAIEDRQQVAAGGPAHASCHEVARPCRLDRRSIAERPSCYSRAFIMEGARPPPAGVAQSPDPRSGSASTFRG